MPEVVFDQPAPNMLYQAAIASSRAWSCLVYGGSHHEEDCWKDRSY
jgi:hypothetical protein